MVSFYFGGPFLEQGGRLCKLSRDACAQERVRVATRAMTRQQGSILSFLTQQAVIIMLLLKIIVVLLTFFRHPLSHFARMKAKAIKKQNKN